MNEIVGVVVATFNRQTLLRECLDALGRQTRPPEHIVVVDNASTDGTAKILAERYPAVHVVRLAVNAGSAGGVKAGMRRAYDLGCGWVWVMDDDAEPADDALHQLCGAIDGEGGAEGVAALACLKTDASGNVLCGHRGYFSFEAMPRRVIRPIGEAQVAFGRPVEIDHASFVGLMVSRRAIEAVGYPDPRLFLQFDDLEYCIRLRGYGRILLVPGSRIVHKEIAPAGVRRKRLLGLPYESLPFEAFWKRYFVYRNFVWLCRRYGVRRVKVVFGLTALCAYLVVMTMTCESRRFRRTRLLLHAFVDGWVGRFDNAKPWRLLYDRKPPQSGRITPVEGDI